MSIPLLVFLSWAAILVALAALFLGLRFTSVWLVCAWLLGGTALVLLLTDTSWPGWLTGADERLSCDPVLGASLTRSTMNDLEACVGLSLGRIGWAVVLGFTALLSVIQYRTAGRETRGRES